MEGTLQLRLSRPTSSGILLRCRDLGRSDACCARRREELAYAGESAVIKVCGAIAWALPSQRLCWIDEHGSSTRVGGADFPGRAGCESSRAGCCARREVR